jgi:hypothetical protein
VREARNLGGGEGAVGGGGVGMKVYELVRHLMTSKNSGRPRFRAWILRYR